MTKKKAAEEIAEVEEVPEMDLETARMATLDVLRAAGPDFEAGELATLVRSVGKLDELQRVVAARTNPETEIGSKLRTACGVDGDSGSVAELATAE